MPNEAIQGAIQRTHIEPLNTSTANSDDNDPLHVEDGSG